MRKLRGSAVYEDERGIIMTAKHRKSAAAFTLIEIVTAILIVTIVVAGGSFLFITGRNQVNLQKHYRAATHLASQKLEELKAGLYSDIAVGEIDDPCNPISLDGASYTRVINTVNAGTYKEVTVTVSWKHREVEQITRNVSLVTLIAP